MLAATAAQAAQADRLVLAMLAATAAQAAQAVLVASDVLRVSFQFSVTVVLAGLAHLMLVYLVT